MRRDVHRQRTYDAETVAFAGTVLEDLVPFDTLVNLADQVCATRFWETEAAGAGVLVARARPDATRSWARPATGLIRLTAAGCTLATLAHELAHVAAGVADVGHSPRFRALEVAIVRLLAGEAPAERLAAAFAAARLALDDLADRGDEAGHTGLVDPKTRVAGDERLARARTIRKLLDRANRTDVPAEAEACQAKAAELMARYRVDELLLASLTGTVDEIVERRLHLGSGPYVQARTRLVEACAEAHGCTVFWRTGSTYNTVHIVGHVDDVAAALAVHTMLAAHAAAALRSARTTGNALAWRRAFLVGYAAAAAERLRAATKSAVTAADAAGDPDQPSVTLVLAARAEQVDRYMREHHASLRTVAPAPARLHDARAAGARAAQTADIGRRRLPKPNRQLHA